MDLQKLLINSAGRLRSGWRLVVFALVYMTLIFLVTSGMRLAYTVALFLAPGITPGNFIQDGVFRLMLIVSSLGAAFVCTRWLEGLPWRAVGLSRHSGWFRDLVIGSAFGIVSLALATAMATAGGGLRFSLSSAGMLPQVGKTLVLSGALFAVAALAEEALFRGYPLQTLARTQLPGLGILITSVGFAASHLLNPNLNQGLAIVNLLCAGVWLAVAYLRTRSLWFPLGVHWGWNWALGSLFGLPVSGLTRIAPHPLLQGSDLGPAWLTGGSFGIEGGIACTITLVISTIFIWHTRLISSTEEMRRLTSQENPINVVAGDPDVSKVTGSGVCENSNLE